MSIELRNFVIRCYGNKAGYVEDAGDPPEAKAVVDTMFATPELAGWLSERKFAVEWREGVYDKLNSAQSGAEPELKRVRIWQLKADSDPLMKFIGYDEFRGSFGEPSREDYETVYDGQPGVNDLDRIFELFNVSRPEGFAGHSLSMSDVVELYDDDGSEFRYVDRFGFTAIEFDAPEQDVKPAPRQGGYGGMSMQ